MAIKDPQTQWKALKSSTDYREFLRSYLDVNNLGFSDLARQAGFGRSFPSDVVSGRRRLTAKSYPAFAAVLKLRALEKKLFKYLVAKEEKEIFPELRKQHASLDGWIADIRKKSSPEFRREVLSTVNSEFEIMLRNPDVIAVFAAVGEPSQGQSFAAIRLRTQLDAKRLSVALVDLEKFKLIKHQNGIYEPVDLHLFFRSQDNRSLVVSLFKQACEKAARRSQVALSSDQEMFFISKICVDKKKLPELKKRLREVVLSFADEAIDSDGDQIINLVAAMHL